MKRTALSGILAASLMVLGACGASEEDKAKESISTYLMDQQSDEQMVDLKQDEAECISGDMVDGIGVDQLKEYGFLKEDGSVNKNASTPVMSEKDSTTLVDAMFDCTDVMATMKQELASTMGEQSPAVKKCFDEALTEERVRGLLVATFAGKQDEASKELTGPLMECAMAGAGSPQN